jgi:hypothetical protein
MGRPYSNRAPTMTTSLGFNDDNNSEEHTITSSIYNVDTGSMQKDHVKTSCTWAIRFRDSTNLSAQSGIVRSPEFPRFGSSLSVYFSNKLSTS